MGILILLFVVLAAGISLGFMLGFSHAMREAASGMHGIKRPVIAKLSSGLVVLRS